MPLLWHGITHRLTVNSQTTKMSTKYLEFNDIIDV